MNISPSIPWALVPVGAVVLAEDGETARVMVNDPLGPDHRVILLEGVAPGTVRNDQCANLVHLDETDAIGTLQRAGFTVEIIE